MAALSWAQFLPISPRSPMSANVIEIFVRLGLALLLSLSLALLMAWGWHSSDPAPSRDRALVEASASTALPN